MSSTDHPCPRLHTVVFPSVITPLAMAAQGLAGRAAALIAAAGRPGGAHRCCRALAPMAGEPCSQGYAGSSQGSGTPTPSSSPLGCVHHGLVGSIEGRLRSFGQWRCVRALGGRSETSALCDGFFRWMMPQVPCKRAVVCAVGGRKSHAGACHVRKPAHPLLRASR